MEHDTGTLSVVNGNNKGIFVKTEAGWQPDWFYENDRAMLRFKDHEWLSIGHVHPQYAAEAEALDEGGYVFKGADKYGETPVHWEVVVMPDSDSDGFLVECSIIPEASIELLEAYSTFETPYEYDGTETATTVPGMNPVYKWKGSERLTPPVWEHPAWIYSRPQAARITAPCNAPYLCHAISTERGLLDRYIILTADWNVCGVHDVHVTPTRTTPNDPGPPSGRRAEQRGYKYYMGALNWGSAYTKDPNVLYRGNKRHRQRVTLQFSSEIFGNSLDEMLLQAWTRASRFDFPKDGKVEAWERMMDRGISWQKATNWLRNVFCSDKETTDLYKPGEGICTYARGTRPRGGGSYTFRWWRQWGGLLHYRASLAEDEELKEVCRTNDEAFLEECGENGRLTSTGMATGTAPMPMLWWVCLRENENCLFEPLRDLLNRVAEHSAEENGKQREFDYGTQATVAEALLLGTFAYGDSGMKDQAWVLLREMTAKLDADFWRFNAWRSDSLAHGGQIRSLGHAHAATAVLLAYWLTGDEEMRENAHRFGRYLLSVSYATHNGSMDPDFDWRGWCNGSNAGRDQIAEFPPWETQNGLLAVATLMNDLELESGFFDALWYIGRTGLAQFPAARSLKRIFDESGSPGYVRREEIASERDFYEVLPYLAYENPLDQTMLASYQGTDCLLGDFVYGHGLAYAEDSRVGVLVPRTATLALAEKSERKAIVWNPTETPIETQVRAYWPDSEQETAQKIEAPPRESVAVQFSRET